MITQKFYLFNKAYSPDLNPIEHKWAQAKSKKQKAKSKKQKKREWLRYRDFVLSPYDVIKIKSVCYIANRLKNDYSQCPDMWQKIQLIVIKIMSLGYIYLNGEIDEIDKELKTHLAEDETAQRLLTIPGVGPITASLLATPLGDGKNHASSRDFAASTGLVLRQYSTGGKTTLMGISKRGDKNLRRRLVQCARVFMQRLEHNPGRLAEWVKKQLVSHHSNVVACALANKLARIAWAVTVHQAAFSK
ncbi:IS110 family transposase [Symbiopectobacterium sp. RP]|uniref:IS110 family transposase n=1 Tax=Symbiopectobacterium sp. RP TaxID=3248553 RepID=UPI003D266C8D